MKRLNKIRRTRRIHLPIDILIELTPNRKRCAPHWITPRLIISIQMRLMDLHCSSAMMFRERYRSTFSLINKKKYARRKQKIHFWWITQEWYYPVSRFIYVINASAGEYMQYSIIIGSTKWKRNAERCLRSLVCVQSECFITRTYEYVRACTYPSGENDWK